MPDPSATVLGSALAPRSGPPVILRRAAQEPGTVISLADRLSAERRRCLVGRAAELDLFDSAIAAPELPFYLLWVCGPGGVGKTALLAELGRQCASVETPVLWIDGRRIEPTPESFLGALRRQLRLGPDDSPIARLHARSGRHVLLIDRFDSVIPIQEWVLEELLPQLPAETLVVVASRPGPPLPWGSDPGWRRLCHVMRLENLSPEDGRTYLRIRDVSPELDEHILELAEGLPLALAVAADLCAQGRQIQLPPVQSRSGLETLVGALVREAPSALHRAALEAGAVVNVATPALLSELLDVPEAYGPLSWLRGLSFVEPFPRGVALHAVVSGVLSADLRARDPDRYRILYSRARAFYMEQLRETAGGDREHLVTDYARLHRAHPLLGPYRVAGREYQCPGLFTDWVRDDDVPAVTAMVRQHEGEASARIAARWLERQRRGTLLVRSTDGEVLGFFQMVALQEASADDLAADPGAGAVWRHVRRTAPLAPGDSAILVRFWMARDTYQAASKIQDLLFVAMGAQLMTVPRLALSFTACSEFQRWAPTLWLTGALPISDAVFELDGRRFEVFGRDWGASSLPERLAKMAEPGPTEAAVASPRPPVASDAAAGPRLDESAFAVAVRDALRNFTAPDLLRHNPLTRSRAVLERTAGDGSADARVAALRSLVKEGVGSLGASTRRAKLQRALHHTYVEPAGSQECVAELLDLPLGTYRDHLKAGLTVVSEILWQRESG
jgi:hypothetical protein